MRKFIDLDTDRMVEILGVQQLTESIEQKRAPLGVLEVQYFRGGTVVELASNAEGRYEIKNTGEYDSPVAITGAEMWTKVGTGTNTFYRFAYGLINPAIDAALGVEAPTTIASVTVDPGNLFTPSSPTNYAANDRVQFAIVDTTAVLPAPLQPGQHYFVATDGLTTSAFKVSETQGGPVLAITDIGTATYGVVKVSDDVVFKDFMSEVSWQEDGLDHKTQTIKHTIVNDVNRSEDKIPDSPAIVYRRGSVRFGTLEPPTNDIGIDGDIYVNQDSGNVYQRDGGVYSLIGNFQGRDAGFQYTYDGVNITGDPTSGKFLFDDTTFTDATLWNISKTDGNSNNLANFLLAQDDSTSAMKCLVMIRKVASSAYLAFYITNTLTPSTNYDTFPITPISSGGTISSGDLCHVVFIRTGDKGTAGSSAVPGLSYLWNTNTSVTDPTTGHVKVNGTVDRLSIYKTDADSGAVGGYLATWDDDFGGRISIIDPANPANFLIVDTDGTAAEHAGVWLEFPILAVANGGTLTNNLPVRVQFTPAVGGGGGGGGGSSFSMKFSSSTTTLPAGDGWLLGNNATFDQSTSLKMRGSDLNAVDFSSLQEAFKNGGGMIQVIKTTAPDNVIVFPIMSWTPSAGVVTMVVGKPVIENTSGGPVFSDTDLLTVTFLPGHGATLAPNTQNNTYEFKLVDMGHQVYHDSTSAHEYDINGATPWPPGAAIVVVNETGAGDLTIDVIGSAILKAGIGSTTSVSPFTVPADSIVTLLKTPKGLEWKITGAFA